MILKVAVVLVSLMGVNPLVAASDEVQGELATDEAAGELAADEAAGELAADEAAIPSAVHPDHLTPPEPAPPEIHKPILRYSWLVGFPVGVLGYGRQFWGWGDTSKFRFGREGWFGYDTDLGGTDKLGHAHVHYMLTRVGYRLFDYTEDGHWRKWPYSIGVAAVIGTGIEIGDGYTGAFGFSWEDLIADYVGIAFGALMEYSPKADSLLGFTAFYIPTPNFRKHEDSNIMKIESDGSGWKHMINFKLSGLHESFGVDLPWYLRILQFDVGYYTTGFSDWDRYAEVDDKYRAMFFGMSLNYQRISRELLRPVAPRTHGVANEVLHYVHPPYGLYYNWRMDN